MNQPHIIEVDPQRIKFNKQNPRKHNGAEYESLKQSIQEMGIVQPPLVRHTTGIFYEVIDGEGRVSVAQDLGLPTIKVVNLGDVTEDEAMEKLVISNMVRTFDFLAQCKGMANLHRRGESLDKIAKMLGIAYPGMASYSVGVGYLPEDIIRIITNDMILSDERAQIWSKYLIRSILPLRQLLPGKSDNTGRGTTVPMDETLYNFDEVRRAVKMVVDGKIKNGAEMRAYAAERDRELYEQRFNQELQARLQEEIARAEKALEEAKALDIEKAEAKARKDYQIQIDTLEVQLAEVRGERDKALEATAASEQDKQVIKKLSEEAEKTKAAQRTMKKEIQDQLRREQVAEMEAWKKKAEAEAKERREAMERERAEAKAKQEEEQRQAKDQLIAYYKEKDAKRQFKAEADYRQLIASASQHLAESQQSILTLTSQDMLRGIEWLSQEELASLLFAMRATRNTLEEAEQSIQEKMGVISSEMVIEDPISERSLMNHHG